MLMLAVLMVGALPVARPAEAGAAPTDAPDGAPSKRPNIVIIVADDMGWNVPSYHHGFVKTPNIDRIAHQGVELDRFYVSPICSPTRAGIMTGRYPLHFGMARGVVRPWVKYGLPPKERTIAEALADSGYKDRAAFGKWHLGHLDPKWHPLSQGFSHFEGCYNGAVDYFTRDRMGQVDWHLDWTDIQPPGYTTDMIADRSVEFIQKHAKDDSPFFCYTAFTAPHEPLEAPQKYLDQYKELDHNASDGKPSPKQRLAAMSACMDDGIGRILKTIEDQGIAKNTLIWFTSDNGGIARIPGNNTPLRGHKFDCYEGGVRVPAAVWWPGVIEGGKKIETPLVNEDILPTVVHVAGGKMEAPAGPIDGRNVWSVLAGSPEQAKLEDRDIYYIAVHGKDEQIGVSTNDGWKLVVTGPDIRQEGGIDPEHHKIELFNLTKDPFEKTDLSGKNPDRVKELGAKLIAFRKSESANPMIPPNKPPADFAPPPNWHNAPASRSNAAATEAH
jgi:arylsulfatase B